MHSEHPLEELDLPPGFPREVLAQAELLTVRARVAAAEERLLVALAAGNVGSWEYHPRSAVLCCDPKFKSFFGFAALETPTAPDITSRIHPDDRERVREAVT